MKKRSKPKVEVIPAILVKSRKQGIASIKKAAVVTNKLQIDIIDGKFAHNKTVMPKAYKGLRSKVKFEWHLMVKNPQALIHEITAIPQSYLVWIHMESFLSHSEIIAAIEHVKFHNLKVGLAINPPTPASKIKKYLELIDAVLVMTVNPGFQKQKWIDMSKKIKQIRKWDKNIDLEVDGGIHHSTGKICKKAGANLFVAGSELFGSKGFKEAYAHLKKEVS